MGLQELIYEFNTYLRKIPNGCLYIAEALRNNDLGSALQAIRDFSEGVLWLVDAAELLNSNGVAYILDISKIEYFLQLINDNLERQNYLAVADMFEREIAEFFKSLSAIENFNN